MLRLSKHLYPVRSDDFKYRDEQSAEIHDAIRNTREIVKDVRFPREEYTAATIYGYFPVSNKIERSSRDAGGALIKQLLLLFLPAVKSGNGNP